LVGFGTLLHAVNSCSPAPSRSVFCLDPVDELTEDYNLKNYRVIRWIIVGLPSGRAVMLAFPVDIVASSLSKIMTVAGATYQTDRGMTAFIVLTLLFATIHIILHRIGNMTSTKTA